LFISFIKTDQIGQIDEIDQRNKPGHSAFFGTVTLLVLMSWLGVSWRWGRKVEGEVKVQ
jgi:hypothetical protein